MRGGWLILALGVAATPAKAQEVPIEVPSGQPVTLQEAFLELQEDGGLWLRLRFVAPALAEGPGQVGFDVAEADMLHLCRSLGLSFAEGQDVSLIVISLADRPVEFGDRMTDVVQFFEAFRPEDGDCIWDEF